MSDLASVAQMLSEEAPLSRDFKGMGEDHDASHDFSDPEEYLSDVADDEVAVSDVAIAAAMAASTPDLDFTQYQPAVILHPAAEQAAKAGDGEVATAVVEDASESSSGWESSDDEVETAEAAVPSKAASSSRRGAAAAASDDDGDDDDGSRSKRFEAPRTKHEIDAESMPVDDPRRIRLERGATLAEAAIVQTIVGLLVIVQAVPGLPPLDEGSVLCLPPSAAAAPLAATIGAPAVAQACKDAARGGDEGSGERSASASASVSALASIALNYESEEDVDLLPDGAPTAAAAPTAMWSEDGRGGVAGAVAAHVSACADDACTTPDAVMGTTPGAVMGTTPGAGGAVMGTIHGAVVGAHAHARAAAENGEDDRPIAVGRIEEIFGPVARPNYSLRFADQATLDALGLRPGMRLYAAVEQANFLSTTVIMQSSLRGSDASDFHDEEPPAEELEFSDDEAEAEAKRRTKLGASARAKASHAAALGDEAAALGADAEAVLGAAAAAYGAPGATGGGSPGSGSKRSRSGRGEGGGRGGSKGGGDGVGGGGGGGRGRGGGGAMLPPAPPYPHYALPAAQHHFAPHFHPGPTAPYGAYSSWTGPPPGMPPPGMPPPGMPPPGMHPPSMASFQPGLPAPPSGYTPPPSSQPHHSVTYLHRPPPQAAPYGYPAPQAAAPYGYPAPQAAPPYAPHPQYAYPPPHYPYPMPPPAPKPPHGRR